MFLLQANFFDYQDHPVFTLVLAQDKVADANGIPPKGHILETTQRHITLTIQRQTYLSSMQYVRIKTQGQGINGNYPLSQSLLTA